MVLLVQHGKEIAEKTCSGRMNRASSTEMVTTRFDQSNNYKTWHLQLPCLTYIAV